MMKQDRQEKKRLEKERAGRMKQMRREIQQECAPAVRLVKRVTAVWLALRVLHTAAMLVLCGLGIFEAGGVGGEIGALAALCLFAGSLVGGVRAVAWLPLLGGLATLASLAVNWSDYVWLAGYLPLFWGYILLVLACGLVQTGGMILLLRSADYRFYADQIAAAAKSVKG